MFTLYGWWLWRAWALGLWFGVSAPGLVEFWMLCCWVVWVVAFVLLIVVVVPWVVCSRCVV